LDAFERNMSPEDILEFIYIKGEAGYTDLVKEFVESKRCAKQTLINYKKQLESSGLIKKRISEKTNRPCYHITEKHTDKVSSILFKRGIEKLSTPILEEFVKRYKKMVIDLMNWWMVEELAQDGIIRNFHPATDEEIKKMEDELSKVGFTKDEIVKMWLYFKGDDYKCLPHFIMELFYMRSPETLTEEEIQRVKDDLKNIEIAPLNPPRSKKKGFEPL